MMNESLLSLNLFGPLPLLSVLVCICDLMKFIFVPNYIKKPQANLDRRRDMPAKFTNCILMAVIDSL